MTHNIPASIQIDAYTGVSLLQKAIRRSETEIAMFAADSLLSVDAKRLWRRLFVTYFEDIGCHNADLTEKIFSTYKAGPKVRNSKRSLHPIIEMMSISPKTQIANNFLHLAIYDLEQTKPLRIAYQLPIEEVFEWACSKNLSQVQKTFLLWIMSGVGCNGSINPPRHPDANLNRLIELIRQHDVFSAYGDLIAEGIKLSRTPLPLASAIDLIENGDLSGEANEIANLSAGQMVRGIPEWCFDMHTRAGSNSIRRAIKECGAISALLREQFPTNGSRKMALSSAHFEYEAALLECRISHSGHLSILRAVRRNGAHGNPAVSGRLYEALSGDWEQFLSIRRQEVERLF